MTRRRGASAGAAAAALLIAVAAVQLAEVHAHGYMSRPKARNQLAAERAEPGPVNYCPHCQNLGGRRTTLLAYPETVDAARGHGLCGDAGTATSASDPCWTGGDCPAQDHMPGGRFFTPGQYGDGGGAIQEVYTEGQEIEVEFYITAHHKGFLELRLCDEARVTEECLQKYPPLSRVRREDDAMYQAQPINPRYDHMFFLNPVCYAGAQEGDNYRMRGWFQLPQGVTCQSCVIQMWWISGNSCVPPNYRDFAFPDEYATCSGDGGDGWYNPTQADCVGSTQAEEFWNCADVSILPSDGSLPPATPVLPPPQAAPTPVNPVLPPPSNPPAQPPSDPPALPPSGQPFCSWTGCASTTPDYTNWCSASESQCAGCGGQWCYPGAPINPPAGCAAVVGWWGDCTAAGSCCEAGSTCVRSNEWYSQCKPAGTRKMMLR